MKLLIAVPTLDYMYFGFCESLTKLVMHLKDEGIDFDVAFRSGTLVYHAREQLAAKARIENYTHMLWLDADMIFTEDLVDDLAFHEKDFVSGIYHARRPPHVSCIFSRLLPEIERFDRRTYPESLFRIAGCGFGCVFMTVDVLRAVKQKFGTCFLPTLALGEDLAFCDRATQCGYELWADPATSLRHIGHVEITQESEEQYMNRLQK